MASTRRPSGGWQGEPRKVSHADRSAVPSALADISGTRTPSSSRKAETRSTPDTASCRQVLLSMCRSEASREAVPPGGAAPLSAAPAGRRCGGRGWPTDPRRRWGGGGAERPSDGGGSTESTPITAPALTRGASRAWPGLGSPPWTPTSSPSGSCSQSTPRPRPRRGPTAAGRSRRRPACPAGGGRPRRGGRDRLLVRTGTGRRPRRPRPRPRPGVAPRWPRSSSQSWASAEPLPLPRSARREVRASSWVTWTVAVRATALSPPSAVSPPACHRRERSELDPGTGGAVACGCPRRGVGPGSATTATGRTCSGTAPSPAETGSAGLCNGEPDDCAVPVLIPVHFIHSIPEENGWLGAASAKPDSAGAVNDGEPARGR